MDEKTEAIAEFVKTQQESWAALSELRFAQAESDRLLYETANLMRDLRQVYGMTNDEIFELI